MNEVSAPEKYPGRVAILQRHVPSYRVEFFDTLATHFPGGLHLIAGMPGQAESKDGLDKLSVAEGHRIKRRDLFRGKLHLYWLSGIAKALTECDPDVLVVEANPRIATLRGAVRWMKQRRRPVAAWGIGTLTQERRMRSVANAMRRRFFSQFDLLIGYGSRAARQFAQLGFPQDRIVVAHNSVVRRQANPLPPARTVDGDRPARLVFVGRLIPAKKIGLLLEACARLPSNAQPEVTIIGEGPARNEFEHVARTTYPCAKFTGALHGADLAEQLYRADLFVLPGTGGLAVQEAMSQGLPVMVAEADGTQDDLVTAANGWQLVPNDVADLTRKLTEALSDRARLQEMGDASYRIIHDEINLDTMAEKFASGVRRLGSTSA